MIAEIQTPQNCVRCDSTDISISNIDGYVCEKCGAWFDVDSEDGSILFAYDHLPESIL